MKILSPNYWGEIVVLGYTLVDILYWSGVGSVSGGPH